MMFVGSARARCRPKVPTSSRPDAIKSCINQQKILHTLITRAPFINRYMPIRHTLVVAPRVRRRLREIVEERASDRWLAGVVDGHRHHPWPPRSPVDHHHVRRRLSRRASIVIVLIAHVVYQQTCHFALVVRYTDVGHTQTSSVVVVR
ncbi:hypothetical protein Q1695_000519 [Nippostrongylus brasiliensis]|nr:hypothetical protein Q1695_000519 [Nippostrongylus brasiliensis]